MSNNTLRLFLAIVLLFANTSMLLGQSDAMAADQRIRTQVNKLGSGAKVTVILKDGTKVKGSISQILEDSFDVTLENQIQSSIISYRDVENVKRRGWSNAAKIGLGVGIGAVVVVVVIVVALAKMDDLGPVFLNSPR